MASVGSVVHRWHSWSTLASLRPDATTGRRVGRDAGEVGHRTHATGRPEGLWHGENERKLWHGLAMGESYLVLLWICLFHDK